MREREREREEQCPVTLWHWLCGCGRHIRPRGLGRHRPTCLFSKLAARLAGAAE